MSMHSLGGEGVERGREIERELEAKAESRR